MLSISFGRSFGPWAVCLLSLASMLLGCSQHSKDQVQKTEESMTSSEPPITSYKLANGLEVYLIEKKAIPMATVLIAVRNGSFIETTENNGLAHLYEHMFFKANEKIPSQ